MFDLNDTFTVDRTTRGWFISDSYSWFWGGLVNLLCALDEEEEEVNIRLYWLGYFNE